MLNFISDYLSDKGIKLFEECSTLISLLQLRTRKKRKWLVLILVKIDFVRFVLIEKQKRCYDFVSHHDCNQRRIDL